MKCFELGLKQMRGKVRDRKNFVSNWFYFWPLFWTFSLEAKSLCFTIFIEDFFIDAASTIIFAISFDYTIPKTHRAPLSKHILPSLRNSRPEGEGGMRGRVTSLTRIILSLFSPIIAHPPTRMRGGQPTVTSLTRQGHVTRMKGRPGKCLAL